MRYAYAHEDAVHIIGEMKEGRQWCEIDIKRHVSRSDDKDIFERSA